MEEQPAALFQSRTVLQHQAGSRCWTTSPVRLGAPAAPPAATRAAVVKEEEVAAVKDEEVGAWMP
jgi:hypothetical protein